jgi:virginiamycin A acetyltransferase
MAPDKNVAFPLPDYDRLCFLKNIITKPNIHVGDYNYYDDLKMPGIRKKCEIPF